MALNWLTKFVPFLSNKADCDFDMGQTDDVGDHGDHAHNLLIVLLTHNKRCLHHLFQTISRTNLQPFMKPVRSTE
jgi:hypothetical protein